MEKKIQVELLQISYLNDSRKKKPTKGNFRELKSKKCTGEASLQTPLEACAVGARLGNPSVFILDPCLELAQVLHEKWGHLVRNYCVIVAGKPVT